MKKLDKNSFGWRLREARRKKGLTQKKFAKYIFVNAAAVSQWECGHCTPSVETLILICNTFNVSADWLLGIKREERENDSEQFI